MDTCEQFESTICLTMLEIAYIHIIQLLGLNIWYRCLIIGVFIIGVAYRHVRYVKNEKPIQDNEVPFLIDPQQPPASTCELLA